MCFVVRLSRRIRFVLVNEFRVNYIRAPTETAYAAKLFTELSEEGAIDRMRALRLGIAGECGRSVAGEAGRLIYFVISIIPSGGSTR